MDHERLIAALADSELFANLVHSIESSPAQPARFAELSATLHPKVTEMLADQGITQYYTHQAFAIDAALRGENVIVATGTSSGKTLCYHVPTLQALCTEPIARALYVFPTKALAQDQVGRLRTLTQGTTLGIETYDGDTAPSRRGMIRQNAQVVMTNPDMLHLGILPQNELWGKFFRALRVIVIDELHTYKGVFGSHFALVLRRLMRLCARYGSHPQILCASATIANPNELFAELTGRSATLVDDDGAPSSPRTTFFCSIPDELDKSPNVATAELIASLVNLGIQTLAFCRARVTVELVLRGVRRILDESAGEVESYRGGYTAKERRSLEKRLFSGKLRGMVATNAMEMGIDVGSLDAVVLNGLPGSIAAFRQQVGRAGRTGKHGIAVALAHPDPLEEFLVRQPETLLYGQVERSIIQPNNPHILSAHLRCAAHEQPIRAEELSAWPSDATRAADSLVEAGELQFQAGRYYYPSHTAPAASVSLRGTTQDTFILHQAGTEIAHMEKWRALQDAHTGAIYLHRGESYRVTSLDLVAREAWCEPSGDTKYFTQSVVSSVVEPEVTLFTAETPIGEIELASVRIVSVVTGFRRMSLDGEKVLDEEALQLPPHSLRTIAARIDLPIDLTADLEVAAEAIHAAQHALVAAAPILAGCDRGDLGSAWYALWPKTMQAAVFVFDAAEGGIGLAEALVEKREDWFAKSLAILESCPCESGCPKCLLSPRCEVRNSGLDKQAGAALLRSLAVSG